MGLKFLLGQMKVGLDKISRDTKAGVPNTDSQKGMLLYYQFQCRQKKYPIPYRNNLLVQKILLWYIILSSLQMHLVLWSFHGGCSK